LTSQVEPDSVGVTSNDEGVSMKRCLTAIAVAFAACFAATGCNDYGNTFQSNTGAFLQFVSPSNVTAGGPDLTIIVTGSGFVTQTIVTWNQAKLKTCVVTTTAANVCAPANDTGTILTVSAVVPAAMFAKPGTAFVQTVQPHSGTGTNGLSNPVAFEVFSPPNPVPTITSITPNTAPAGTTPVTLTIVGTNFLSAPSSTTPPGGSQVVWNTTTQTTLTPSTITATQIQVTVPPTSTPLLLATAGTATVTVFNPPAPGLPSPPCQVNCNGFGGGGTSNAATFTITGTGGNTASASAALVEDETPAVSLDGRYAAYSASQGGHTQIFARDTCQGADPSCQQRTILISSALDGTAGSDDSHSPSMSSDGRYVAFSSVAANLVTEAGTSAAPSPGRQVYLRDTCFGVGGSCTPSTQLISTDPNGTLVGTEGILPSLSASGRFVAFLAVTPSPASSSPASQSTAATSKSAASVNNSGYRQVYVRDTCLGTANCTPKTTRISLQPGDGSGTGTGTGTGSGTTKPAGPAISGGGDHVALAGGTTATLFMRSVAVDDGVFVALTKSQQ
jgi:Tol biopolymer transport system component